MSNVVTIIDLIRNGTITSQIAATMWAAVDRGLSIVVVAIPRFAGKTTMSNAILSLLPPEINVHRLSGEEEEMDKLKDAATGGYLVVGEFSKAPVPHYIWGSPVRLVFDILSVGYSLATALHASGLEETFDVICKGNGVSDEAASRIDLMLYIRRFGADIDSFSRRLSEVHEIDYIQDGKPHARQLFQWLEDSDVFEQVDIPKFIHGDESELAERTATIEYLANTGQRKPQDVARLVVEYRSNL